MKRPYILCHMMASLDGRIDCAMTAKCAGVDTYYETLAALDVPTTLSGRVTAETELALPGKFSAQNKTPIGKTAFEKMTDAPGYSVVVDTRGTLLWDSATVDGKPLLVLMSEEACAEYAAYLTAKGISYIACGKERIDLPRACELLRAEFGVTRMGVVGGGSINAAFLDAGLLDEVSVVLAPAIDGRGGEPALFDNLPKSREPFPLTLQSAAPYADGSVWLRYKTMNNVQ